MRRRKGSHVYRVSPGPVNTWRVSIDPAREIASFNDKSAALDYAMHLARGEVSWQPPAAADSATELMRAGASRA